MESRWRECIAGGVTAALVVACAAPAQQETDTTVLERRTEALEKRVQRLEAERLGGPAARTFPAAPFNDSSEETTAGAARLEVLRERRRTLLKKYTPGYPDVIFLDREIRRLELGLPEYPLPLRELSPASPAP